MSDLRALVQQPAAVDGAMAQRILTQYLANDPGDVWPPERQGELRVKALQDAINNALAQQPAAVDGDYQRGLAFILAHRDAIIARCVGPSEQFVVERTFDALAAQPQGDSHDDR